MSKKLDGFSQERGRWVARCPSTRIATLCGSELVPVLRDYRNREFDWSVFPVKFTANLDTSIDGAWWMKQEQSKWRALLEARVPVLVRKATRETPEEPNGSVGQKIGLFVPGDVTITENEIDITLIDRLDGKL